jgi:membrane protein
MKKFVIDHFDLRSKELKLLTVLEYIFMFCIVGLSLVLVNQSGEKLTEGSVSVSDAVSITCEALMYLCVVSLLALLHRGLGRVGRVNRVSMCRDALAFAIASGVVYVVLGKLLLFCYNTEAFPDLLDWAVFLTKTIFLGLMIGIFGWIYSNGSSHIRRCIRRALFVALLAVGLVFFSTYLFLLGLPAL